MHNGILAKSYRKNKQSNGMAISAYKINDPTCYIIFYCFMFKSFHHLNEKENFASIILL